MDDRRVPTDLAALPKAEVHVHLEGSVRPATLDELCHRGRYVVPRTFHDLNGFIHAVSAAWTTMMQPGDYARLVREYCEDAARAGIRYAEVELVPGGRPYDCLGEAVEAASRQRDVAVRFVAGLNRDLPLELAWMMLEATKGVPESVNTDNPGFFGCDLVGEYAIAGRLLGLDRAGYARLALNSVESTFAPEEVKADLRRAIADWLDG